MKTKIILSFSIVILILAATCGVLKHRADKLKAEKSRIEQNQKALLTDVERYVTKDSMNGLRIEALVFSEKELKKYAGDLTARLEERNIRIKDLESALATHSTMKIDTFVMVKDSIVRDTLYKCIRYHDKWNDLDVCHDGRRAQIMMEVRDSLTVLVSVNYTKKFLWWKWKPQGSLVDILNENDKVRIDNAKIITTK